MQIAFALVVAVLALGSSVSAQTLVVTDDDVLNFALQAECLAASFWNAAAYGTNLTAAQLGTLPLAHLPPLQSSQLQV